MPDDFNRQTMVAKMHIQKVKHLADNKQMVWEPFPAPAEVAHMATAVQAFQGQYPGYMVLVIQANTKEHGIVTEAVITTTSMQIIRVPKDDPDKSAEYLFKAALKATGQA